jgi:hypothetical protein
MTTRIDTRGPCATCGHPWSSHADISKLNACCRKASPGSTRITCDCDGYQETEPRCTACAHRQIDHHDGLGCVALGRDERCDCPQVVYA